MAAIRAANTNPVNPAGNSFMISGYALSGADRSGASITAAIPAAASASTAKDNPNTAHPRVTRSRFMICSPEGPHALYSRPTAHAKWDRRPGAPRMTRQPDPPLYDDEAAAASNPRLLT